MRDEDFHDLLIRRVVTDLSDEERLELQAELERRGEEGRRKLRRVRETFAQLSLTASPEEPPAALRDEVLDAVAETPQPERREAAPDDDRSGSGRGTGPVIGRGWLAAAAAVVAAVSLGLVYWNVQLQSDLDRAQLRLDSMATQLARADSARRALAALQRDLATVASPTATVRTMAGTDQEPNARARVFVDPATGRALLFAYRLPILPPDSVYQLWAIEGEEPRSLGTFTSSGQDPARVELESLDTVRTADALAVTVEPAPGQPAPTGEMVLQGSL